ncbi:amidohydrolase family protein [Oscillospiraceae bacterium OttesenSCG-928-G22]|nr:amidohydrolase family protein [Oscillospiraceae bacterium OttesenSCG-928-G22]
MLIDFHAHCYPDELAEKAVRNMGEISGQTHATDGTLRDTIRHMRDWRVDAFVVLNIAMNPTQHRNVNDFAAAMSSETVFGFGSVFPGAKDATEELLRIRKLGLKGVKLHADFQDFMFDDPVAYPVYDTLAELGLPLVVHAGFDPVSPQFIHCPPSAIRTVADRFPTLQIVAAHLGGMLLWDEVERHLVGVKNVALDTAMLATYITPEQCARIINNHERIVFGSDCPWHSPALEHEFLLSLGLPEKRYEDIFYKNAMALLGL